MRGNDKFFTVFRTSVVNRETRQTSNNSSIKPNKLTDKNDPRKSMCNMMWTVLSKIHNRHRQRIFLKLMANTHTQKSKMIVARMMTNTLNHVISSNKKYMMIKFKVNRKLKLNLFNFAKLINTLSRSKAREFKSFALFKLQRNIANFKAPIQKKLAANSSLDGKHFVRDRSLNTQTVARVPMGANLRNKKIESPLTERVTTEPVEDISKIKKQHEFFKLMELSEQAKLALKRVQKFTNKNYPQQVEQFCKETLALEMRRLEKVKNANRDMRMFFYDNQLTVTVLCHQMKAISQQNEEIAELRQIKILWEKEEEKRKQKQFVAKRNAASNPEKHRENVEKQMRTSMENIHGLIGKNQLEKAISQIDIFNKKYEKEQYAKDIVMLYKLLAKQLSKNKSMDDCLKQISKILWTLSTANLQQKNQCLRALKSNHREFNFLKTKYQKDEEIYEKKMLSILKHLEDFNKNIINYLQVSNQLEKTTNNLNESVSRLKVDYEQKYQEQLNSVQKKYRDQRSTSAQIYNQSTTLNFQKSALQSEKVSFEKFMQTNKEFQKKINAIISKMDRKVEWAHDFQMLKKDPSLQVLHPFGDFFAFGDASRRFYDSKIRHEVQNFSDILESLKKIFHKQKLKHEQRFNEVAKILEASGKRDPHLYQLHKSIQLLMIAIVERTQQEDMQKQVKKLENQNTKLNKEKKDLENRNQEYKIRVKNLADANRELSQSRSMVGSRSLAGSRSIAGSRSSLTGSRCLEGSRQICESRSKDQSLEGSRSRNGSLADSRSRQKNGNEPVALYERDIAQKLQTFLNKAQNIFFKQVQTSTKLFEMQKTFSHSVKKHPQLKKIYQILNKWIKFLIQKSDKNCLSP